MKRIYLILLISAATLYTACQSQDPNANDFDNKVFIDNASRTTTLLIERNTTVTEMVKTLQMKMAKPETEEIDVLIKAAPGMVDAYNLIYSANALVLPTECYEIPEEKTTIAKGGVISSIVNVKFKNLDKLKIDETIYVLPITISTNSKVPVLQSASTQYYVFQQASLINVVANIKENYLSIDWKNQDPLRDLSTLTMEALIRSHSWDNAISTIMGVESKVLLRVGDVMLPKGQLQVACANSYKFPDASRSKILPLDEWIHVAVTADVKKGVVEIYINGELQSEGSFPQNKTIDLNNSEFYIGKSWDDLRWFNGEICECRIWNLVRTKEEIAASPYFVEPTSPGLVAYWKFNEGEGNIVRDYSSSGNNAVSNKPLSWMPESLPSEK